MSDISQKVKILIFLILTIILVGSCALLGATPKSYEFNINCPRGGDDGLVS